MTLKLNLFVAPYGELRKGKGFFDWESETIYNLSHGIQTNKKLWHFKVENSNTLCGKNNSTIQRIKISEIALSDAYTCYKQFQFNSPIKDCWVEL